MKPTLKFRWLVLSNPCTAEDVRTFRDKNGCSGSEAQRVIKNTQPPVLQQWFEYEGLDCGEWQDVETVVEPHP